VTPDTLVIDIAPEFAVVLGVWNGDLSLDCCTVARAKSNSETSVSSNSTSMRIRSASMTMRCIAGLSPQRERDHAGGPAGAGIGSSIRWG